MQDRRYPYVYVDGIYLRRNWGGEYENVAILVAIRVNEDGYREVLGAAEGMKEDKASRVSFFPEAKYQRCTVRFCRNVFSATPRSKVKLVAIQWGNNKYMNVKRLEAAIDG